MKDLKHLETSEQVAIGILDLVMTWKLDANILISSVARFNCNDKPLKVNTFLRNKCNLKSIYFIVNNHLTLRFLFDLRKGIIFCTNDIPAYIYSSSFS